MSQWERYTPQPSQSSCLKRLIYGGLTGAVVGVSIRLLSMAAVVWRRTKGGKPTLLS